MNDPILNDSLVNAIATVCDALAECWNINVEDPEDAFLQTTDDSIQWITPQLYLDANRTRTRGFLIQTTIQTLETGGKTASYLNATLYLMRAYPCSCFSIEDKLYRLLNQINANETGIKFVLSDASDPPVWICVKTSISIDDNGNVSQTSLRTALISLMDSAEKYYSKIEKFRAKTSIIRRNDSVVDLLSKIENTETI